MNDLIPASFFERDPVTCARELVGCELIWGSSGGVVVETEAYAALGDEACHTFSRPSARAFVERHTAGTAYVYMNYGVHWLLNVLTKCRECDGFVLIRALRPMRGIEAMVRRRGTGDVKRLASGPGKLSAALGVNGADHGSDLCTDPGRAFRFRESDLSVTADYRVGISRANHLRWRFLETGSEFVSVPCGKGGSGGAKRMSKKKKPTSGQ